MIKYIQGDIFEYLKKLPSDIYGILPHVANNCGVMGAGFVVPLRKYYAKAYNEYIKLSSKWPGEPDDNKLGEAQVVKVADNLTVVNMVAQTLGGKRPLNYEHLVRCMADVRDFVIQQQQSFQGTRFQIHTVMFGAGLAGGNWSFIEELIHDIWVAHKIPVFVYKL